MWSSTYKTSIQQRIAKGSNYRIGQQLMKQQTFIDAKGNIVARGRITEIAIDLLLNDGTRFYSTKSDNYTLDFIKQLDIVKVVK
jgi:hypothetical protein